MITFGFLLMFQDVFRFLWGATPRTMDNVYMAYGAAHVLGVRVPTYNLLVIAASLVIAVGLGLFLERTKIGQIVHARAENRDMAEGLGVNTSKIFALVFTVGCMLGTVGGALVVPSGAASLDMAVELVVKSFAVVVIGGLGSMRGALVGALVVGLMRAAAISLVPELEMLSVYLVVVVVLIVQAGRPVREGDRVSNPSIDIASPANARRTALRPNGLWVLLGLIWRHGADAVDRFALCSASDAAVHRLRHRAFGVQSVVWKHRAVVVRPCAVSWRRRLYRRGADFEIRHPEF